VTLIGPPFVLVSIELCLVQNLVEFRSLRKTGIFADRAGDFRQFRSRDCEIGSWRLSRMREEPGFSGL
jgi:hypothetical protein